MNDVYDVVIHFVRREECRMEESVRKLFTTYTPGGGDDGETTGARVSVDDGRAILMRPSQGAVMTR